VKGAKKGHLPGRGVLKCVIFVVSENPSDVFGTDNCTIAAFFTCHISDSKKTSPVGDVLKSKAHM
jgi:hypothetical protein